MQEKPILVFDLDGTLVDTAADLLDSLNYCLQKQGIAAIASEDLSKYIGHGGQAMIEQALRRQNRPAEPSLMIAMLEDFYAYYAAHTPGKSHYFKGVIEVFQKFSAKGFIFAVCTNKFVGLAKKLIAELNAQQTMKNPFAVICGGDSFDWKKPDPRHIFSVIAAAGGDRNRAIMVGDSAPDIEAARAAGIPSIVVSFGYSDIPIEQLGATKIIDSYDALTPALAEKLLNRKP